MKKIFLIGFLAVSLLLFGCAKEDLPPEPPAPGETGGGALAGQAIAGGEGYSDPTTFSIEFGPWPEEPKGIQLAVEGEQYVYKTGYASLNNGDWVAFEFDQDTVGGSNWISGNAEHFVQLSLLKVGLPGASNGFVAYACTKTGEVWDCHNNKWMAWQFGVEDMYCYDGKEVCPAEYFCDTTCKPELGNLPPEPELPPGESMFQEAPPFFVGISDKSPTSDNILASNIIDDLQDDGYKFEGGIMYLFSELEGDSLDNQVTLLIYNNEARIIIGKNSPDSHNLFAVEVAEKLTARGLDMKDQTYLNVEVDTNDLGSAFS